MRSDRRRVGAGGFAAAALAAAGLLTGCGDGPQARDERPAAFDLDLPEEWRDLEAGSPGAEDGLVTLRYRSGARLAEGEMRAGRKHGAWTYWREDGGVRWTGGFEDDEPHGVERGYHAGGQLAFEGERVHGLREGLYRYWYENGELEMEAEYRADQRHGECKRFTLDGEPDLAQTGRYSDGRKVGPR